VYFYKSCTKVDNDCMTLIWEFHWENSADSIPKLILLQS
jgi:hypothetical protein